jgi:hypothetical protein
MVHLQERRQVSRKVQSKLQQNSLILDSTIHVYLYLLACALQYRYLNNMSI